LCDRSGTGVSPVCWLHDSHGRDARATTLAPTLSALVPCTARAKISGGCINMRADVFEQAVRHSGRWTVACNRLLLLRWFVGGSLGSVLLKLFKLFDQVVILLDQFVVF